MSLSGHLLSAIAMIVAIANFIVMWDVRMFFFAPLKHGDAVGPGIICRTSSRGLLPLLP